MLLIRGRSFGGFLRQLLFIGPCFSGRRLLRRFRFPCAFDYFLDALRDAQNYLPKMYDDALTRVLAEPSRPDRRDVLYSMGKRNLEPVPNVR